MLAQSVCEAVCLTCMAILGLNIIRIYHIYIRVTIANFGSILNTVFLEDKSSILGSHTTTLYIFFMSISFSLSKKSNIF